MQLDSPVPSNTQASPELYVGVMSGTSLDGIDAALVQIVPGAAPRLLSKHSAGFEPQLRSQLLHLASGGATSLRELGQADIGVARAYAAVITALLQNAGVAPSQVRAAGCHGQTVHHEPVGDARFTLQLGDPNTMAVLTGVAVVADFRRRDMALGGQGAPLAPGFHDRVFRHPERTRVVLNLGGIANISVLVPGQPCWGADTGPANILMDAWIHQHLGLSFDADGGWAASGSVQPALLEVLLDDTYFAAPAPKSTGREHFNLSWLQSRLQRLGTAFAPQDVQATLLELTARTVAQALPGGGGDLIVCGGGALNGRLLARLSALAAGWKVDTTASLGIDPQLVEAVAFAYFASRTCSGLPANLPIVTGASRECLLGAVYQP